jgi:methylenetetrahydrofolate reductase (NADPH)
LLTFQKAVREFDFTLSAELPLAPESTRRSIELDISKLSHLVDAFQVTDNPSGIPHMSPLVAAGFCLQHDKDAILHVSGRDRNRIALESEILGAAAAGITSLLMLRGDKLPEDLTPRARKVYEFGAKRLLQRAQQIGEKEALVPAGFFLGSMISVIAPRDDHPPRGIEAKADVGCKFVQTQPLLDVRLLRHYMQRLVESGVIRRVSVIVSVPVLSSAAQLDALLQRPRPALVPGELTASLRASRTPRADGIRMTAEALGAVCAVPGVAGANLVSIEDTDAATETIALARLPPRANGDLVHD